MSNTDPSTEPVRRPRIALAPDPQVGWLRAAIDSGGAEIVPLEDCEAIIWSDARRPEALSPALARAPRARWVQLPFAGIENFVDLLDGERIWTCGKGVYADPVAEMALALGVAGLRGLGGYTRAYQWSGPVGRNLLGGKVSIIGGGGIAESLVRLLSGWQTEITVVRRTVEDMVGVDRVLPSDRLDDALVGADLVVLALALTPATVGMFGRAQFDMMEDHAWLVNVARGRHIVTDELVEALSEGRIGGAGLDVTDPEPLPPGHRLWSLPNCIITPHVGNTPDMAVPLLAARVTDNVRRFSQGRELVGQVDLDAGY